jgi:hypothetical protein
MFEGQAARRTTPPHSCTATATHTGTGHRGESAILTIAQRSAAMTTTSPLTARDHTPNRSSSEFTDRWGTRSERIAHDETRLDSHSHAHATPVRPPSATPVSVRSFARCGGIPSSPSAPSSPASRSTVTRVTDAHLVRILRLIILLSTFGV